MNKNNKKEDIIEMIKNNIKRRKKWKDKEDQWFYLLEHEMNDIIYYTSGRFPEMKVRELTKIVGEIREETNEYKTLIEEIYKNE